MKRTVFAAMAATLLGGAALADAATDQIIADLQSKGFDRIEIDNGIGQIKVEAIRGTQKVEVIYDRATGAILKQEMERVRAGEDTAPGVSIRERNRDFVDAVPSGTGSGPVGAVVATSGGSTDQVIADLQAQGYTRIEVKNGVTQSKVEAIRGTEKLEVVFDRSTGDVLKQETETVRAGDDTQPGVSVRDRDRDFVGDDRSGRDADDDGDDRSGRDDDDDDDHHGGANGNGGDDRGGHGDDDDDHEDDDEDDDEDEDDDDNDDDDSDDDSDDD